MSPHIHRPLSGVFPVLATPFDARGRLDEPSLLQLVRFVLATGAAGLTLGGIASEVYKLADEERRRIVEIVMNEVGGRAPVWVGTGHSSTELAVEHSMHAQSRGAAGVMVMPPYATKPSLTGVASYFRAIDRAVQIPIMIQDAPLVSAVNLPADFMTGLGDELANVRYVKVESPPTGPKVTEVLDRSHGRLRVFGGLGGSNMIDELKRGATGTLPGSAFSEVYVELDRLYHAGDVGGAESLHRNVLPLIRFVSQSVEFSFHAYKRILVRRGIIATPYVRHPSATFDETAEAELASLMTHIDSGQSVEVTQRLP